MSNKPQKILIGGQQFQQQTQGNDNARNNGLSPNGRSPTSKGDVDPLKLRVYNIPCHWNEDRVSEIFSPYCEDGSKLEISFDRHRYLAFVVFSKHQYASNALQEHNKRHFDNQRKIRVQFAYIGDKSNKKKEKPQQKPKPDVSPNVSRKSVFSVQENEGDEDENVESNVFNDFVPLNNSNNNNSSKDKKKKLGMLRQVSSDSNLAKLAKLAQNCTITDRHMGGGNMSQSNIDLMPRIVNMQMPGMQNTISNPQTLNLPVFKDRFGENSSIMEESQQPQRKDDYGELMRLRDEVEMMKREMANMQAFISNQERFIHDCQLQIGMLKRENTKLKNKAKENALDMTHLKSEISAYKGIVAFYENRKHQKLNENGNDIASDVCKDYVHTVLGGDNESPMPSQPNMTAVPHNIMPKFTHIMPYPTVAVSHGYDDLQQLNMENNIQSGIVNPQQQQQQQEQQAQMPFNKQSSIDSSWTMVSQQQNNFNANNMPNQMGDNAGYDENWMQQQGASNQMNGNSGYDENMQQGMGGQMDDGMLFPNDMQNQSQQPQPQQMETRETFVAVTKKQKDLNSEALYPPQTSVPSIFASQNRVAYYQHIFAYQPNINNTGYY